MGVVLRKKKTGKGESLFLDIHHNGKRWKEFLKLYLKPGTATAALKTAKEIRDKRERELILGKHRLAKDSSDDFTEYYLRYKHLEHFRVYKACIYCFMRFMVNDRIPFHDITEDVCRRFKKHLEDTYKGESPYGYFKVFKRMLSDAVREGYYDKSPAEFIVNKNPSGRDIKKDVLLPDEIEKLLAAHCGNNEIRRAAIFSLHTGLRLVDIRLLNWSHINLNERWIRFTQSKTGRQNIVPLNDEAVKILSQISQSSQKGGFIFNLPSTNAVNKAIHNWKEEAKIEKKITFGVCRHSFVSGILLATGNLKLAGSLAGHSSIQMTERYTHILDKEKRKAVNLLGKRKSKKHTGSNEQNSKKNIK